MVLMFKTVTKADIFIVGALYLFLFDSHKVKQTLSGLWWQLWLSENLVTSVHNTSTANSGAKWVSHFFLLYEFLFLTEETFSYLLSGNKSILRVTQKILRI